jgi:uncharacterized membrane-anchored protein
MNSKLRSLLFFGVAAAQAVFILAWAGQCQWVLDAAPVVRLRPGPVDPRDPLRGDYAALNLEIGRVTVPEGIVSFSKVWVELVPDGAFHKTGAIQPVVSGVPRPAGLWAQAWVPRYDPKTRRGQLDFGIDKFFVEEGHGELPRRGDVVVEASLPPSGRMQIKRVLVNGLPWE